MRDRGDNIGREQRTQSSGIETIGGYRLLQKFGKILRADRLGGAISLEQRVYVRGKRRLIVTRIDQRLISCVGIGEDGRLIGCSGVQASASDPAR